MVSRVEFYSTVATLYLFPALLFLASGGPENPWRFWLGIFISFGMIGLSCMYSVMAIREKSRKQEDAEPGAAADGGGM